MWLPRLVSVIEGSDRPVVLTGGEAYGTPFLIEALRGRHPVAWFEVGRGAVGDSVAQGNALARAVDDAIGTRLLGAALPYKAHLAAMRHHAADIGPLWLAMTTELVDEPLLDDLLQLHGGGFRVLLDLRGEATPSGGRPRNSLPRNPTVLGPDELRVSLEEAELLVPRAVPAGQVEALWHVADGRITELLRRGNDLAGIPAPTVPSAAGALVDLQDARLVEAPLAIQALRREGEYVAALELAALKAPELVDDLLRQAGPRFQEDGLLLRLHLLLSALPEEYSRSERVLEWRLVAGFAAADVADVLADVDAYLAVHVAPELRARRAGALPLQQGFELAKQAVEARRTPLTLWQYGRLHPDPDEALKVLRESVQLADDVGGPYDLVRNAGMLVARLGRMGDYAQAARWARWTLDVFDRGDVVDGARRLQVVNDLAMANIMSGDLVGMRGVLENAQALAEGNLPQLSMLLRGTLAALELAESDPRAALELALANYHASPRRARAIHGQLLVRVLLELGRLDEARRVADDVVGLAEQSRGYEWTVARLARGMVGAVSRTEGAAEDLLDAVLATDLAAEHRLSAVLHYLLAAEGGGANLPRDTLALVSSASITALRVASGPEGLFAAVWSSVSKPQASLRLELLGEPVARYEGKSNSLPQRLAEVTAALVANPDGIALEALNDYLVPDGQEPFTKSGMRAMMTRMRKILPVSDAPYRFAVPFSSDLLELRTHLAKREVRQAVALYRSALLPQSQAPGLVEERLNLEEELRQAALEARDADALFSLAERLADDLECWEGAAELLLPGDPRLTVARARVRRLREAYQVG